MDSSSGSPLSTLILLLPLVVVPAVAVLRPAERDSGLVGDDLSASEDSFMSDSDDFEAIFRDLDAESAKLDDGQDDASADAPAFVESDDLSQSLMATAKDERPEPERTRLPSESYSRQRHGHDQRLPDLAHLGVTSSMRFSPGGNSGFGFVAFVPTDKASVRYRFSSIRETEEGAVDDVVQQIRAWREARRGSSNRRVH